MQSYEEYGAKNVKGAADRKRSQLRAYVLSLRIAHMSRGQYLPTQMLLLDILLHAISRESAKRQGILAMKRGQYAGIQSFSDRYTSIPNGTEDVTNTFVVTVSFCAGVRPPPVVVTRQHSLLWCCIPSGLPEVQSVALRLDAARSALAPGSAGDHLASVARVLLYNAPSPDKLSAMETAARAAPVTDDAGHACLPGWRRFWSPGFVDSGMCFLDSGTSSPCKPVDGVAKSL